MDTSDKHLNITLTPAIINLLSREITPRVFKSLGVEMEIPVATLEQMIGDGRTWKERFKLLILEWQQNERNPTFGNLLKIMRQANPELIDVYELEEKIYKHLWEERPNPWTGDVVKIISASSQTGTENEENMIIDDYNTQNQNGLTLILLHVSDVWADKDDGISSLFMTFLANNTLIWGECEGDTSIQELKRKLNKSQWIHIHEYTLDQHDFTCPSMPKQRIVIPRPCDVTVLESDIEGLSCVPVPDPVTTYPPLYKLSQLSNLKNNNINTVRVCGVIKHSDMKMVRIARHPCFDTALLMTLRDESGTAVRVMVRSDEMKNKLLKAKGEYHHIELINFVLINNNQPGLYDSRISVLKIKKDNGHLEAIYNRTFTPQPVVFTKEGIKEFQKFYSQDDVLC